MPRQSYFSPAMFTFLREVEANNNRPWWEENKDRYITLIREPAKEFMATSVRGSKRFRSTSSPTPARTAGR